MDLYDPTGRTARCREARRRNAGGLELDGDQSEVVSKLKAAGSKAVLLARPMEQPGPWEPPSWTLGSDRTAGCHLGADRNPTPRRWPLKQAFGNGRVSRPRLDKADLIVGLGAEFLDRPEDGLEGEFASRRSPDQPDGGG